MSEAEEEASMEDFQCMLEVLQALTVSPAITDAVLPPEGIIKASLPLLRLSMLEEQCGWLMYSMKWRVLGLFQMNVEGLVWSFLSPACLLCLQAWLPNLLRAAQLSKWIGTQGSVRSIVMCKTAGEG